VQILSHLNGIASGFRGFTCLQKLQHQTTHTSSAVGNNDFSPKKIRFASVTHLFMIQYRVLRMF